MKSRSCVKETKEDSFCFLSAVIKKKVDAFREGIGYSGNFGKEMSSSPSATVPPTLTADQLTVIVASVSCLMFFIVVLMLLTVLYRKDPLCCKARSYQGSQHYTDAPPQYHNSRQSLVGYPYDEHSAAVNQDTLGPQLSGRLFIIGKPNNYHLDGPLPRLPSYESVRKKDRQRQIHSMIAQRFGLSSCSTVSSEPPPTYEETLRQSIDISPLDLPSPNSHLSTQTASQDTNLNQLSTEPQGPASSHGPVESTSQGPLSV